MIDVVGDEVGRTPEAPKREPGGLKLFHVNQHFETYYIHISIHLLFALLGVSFR